MIQKYVYRTYMYRFYRQFPSVNEFPGFSGNYPACASSQYQAVFFLPRSLGMRQEQMWHWSSGSICPNTYCTWYHCHHHEMLMGNLFDFNSKLNNWLMVKSVPVFHVDVEPNKETPLTPPSLCYWVELKYLTGDTVEFLIICTTPFSGKDANFRSLFHMYM